MFRAQFLGFCVVSIFLAGQVRADDLDRIKAQNELKAQKLIADVNAALARSRTLEPAEARELLRGILVRLEDDLSLSERQRTALLGQVRNRLRTVIQAARAQEQAEEAASKKEIVRSKSTDRSTGGERQGKSSDTAKDFIKNAKDRLDSSKTLKSKKERDRLAAQAEIDKSASVLMEQRITPRFLAATERRQQKLTAKEKALLKMLNSTLSVDFKEVSLKEALEYIQEKTNNALPIFLDEGSLKEANIESSEPVTFKVRKATVRTILKKILADKGLTYVIKEATIQVVTPQKAREFMVARTYPIGDLIGSPNPFLDPFGLQQMANIKSLINVIKSTIDPSVWEQGGSITFFPPTSLIIRAPAEMHYQLGFGGGYKK